MNSTFDELQKLSQIELPTDEEFIMPFGKYKNECIEDIPNQYLEWLIKEFIPDANEDMEWLETPVQKELRYRKKFNIKL